jgi:hypothetical protein
MDNMNGGRTTQLLIPYSVSRWFHAVGFNDWFKTMLLPKLKRLPRKKFVAADNISTHLNISIFQQCCE